MGANLKKMREAHKVLASFDFEPVQLQGGYANRWLYVNVETKKIAIEETTEEMKRKFIGGKGFDLWIMWNKTTAKTKWNSSDNVICMSPGPLGGTTTYPGSGKSIFTSISPVTGIPIDSNVGGYAGPLLKVCGFDALCVQGKARKDVIVLIDGKHNRVTIEQAPLEDVNAHLASEQFHQMYADEQKDLVNISVISSGRGAEHTLMGCLNVSWWDQRRQTPRIKQAGRGGIGTVFRNKKLKAIVIRTEDFRPRWTITID